jgi:hypothetical protein
MGDGEELEIMLAYHSGDEWIECGNDAPLNHVVGWLHTDDARRILDGGAA